MITYIIPTYANPQGLYLTLKSIRENAFVESVEVIVALESGDPLLAEAVAVCEKEEAPAVPVRYHVYKTPSLTAKINHCAMCVNTPYMSILKDGIILSFSGCKAEERVRGIVDTCTDGLTLLLPSTQGIENTRFPVLPKKFVELTGYAYHPICVGFEICERWLGSIFFQLGRIVEVPELTWSQVKEFPCKIVANPEAKRDAEILYSNTGNVRRYTANMLTTFMS